MMFLVEKAGLNRIVFGATLLLFLISGCANRIESITVNVKPEDRRIYFSGRAGGAGMMLMSTLGPAGIAVGFAIDEGIGKDITEIAQTNNIDFHDMLTTELQKSSPKSSSNSPLTITINRIELVEKQNVIRPKLTVFIDSQLDDQEITFEPQGKKFESNLDSIKDNPKELERLLASLAAELSNKMLLSGSEMISVNQRKLECNDKSEANSETRLNHGAESFVANDQN